MRRTPDRVETFKNASDQRRGIFEDLAQTRDAVAQCAFMQARRDACGRDAHYAAMRFTRAHALANAAGETMKWKASGRRSKRVGRAQKQDLAQVAGRTAQVRRDPALRGRIRGAHQRTAPRRMRQRIHNIAEPHGERDQPALD